MTLASSYSFRAIGTKWSIETEQPLPLSMTRAIDALIERFDQRFSRFRDDSLVRQLADAPGSIALQDEEALMTFYRQLYDATNGRVTPLVGKMLEQAGYDAKYRFTAQDIDSVPDWDQAMTITEGVLTTQQPVTIDIGAAGKGYLVDMISRVLDDAGYSDYVVDGSGDLRHRGNTNNLVGLEHPFDSKRVIGAISVKNISFCASAINRRQWGEGMHHVFDPKIKQPTREVVATWVMADSTMVADGLATALFFVEPEALKSIGDFDYLRVTADGRLDYSPAFEGQLYQ